MIVIIGVIAAIAIPRVSRGASNAETHAAKASLKMRQALEMSKGERGAYPSDTQAGFVQDLTTYDPATGTGPYLHAIPTISLAQDGLPTPQNSVIFNASRMDQHAAQGNPPFAWAYLRSAATSAEIWINANNQSVRDW